MSENGKAPKWDIFSKSSVFRHFLISEIRTKQLEFGVNYIKIDVNLDKIQLSYINFDVVWVKMVF